jgi:hypothetical protein
VNWLPTLPRFLIIIFLLILSVLIVCSPLGSATTIRIINQFKALIHTKILLVDMIGSIFNHQHPIFNKVNASEYENLLVLTVLSEKFKAVLNKSFNVEFSRFYNLDRKSQFAHRPTPEPMVRLKAEPRALPRKWQEPSVSALNQFLVAHNCSISLRQLQIAINQNVSACQRLLAEACTPTTNATIQHICQQLTNSPPAAAENLTMSLIPQTNKAAKQSKYLRNSNTTINNNNYYYSDDDNNDEVADDEDDDDGNGDNNIGEDGNVDFHKMNNHFIFSEYFNLFSFVASIVVPQQQQQQPSTVANHSIGNASVIPFDFVVLDFRHILNNINESIVIWRPFLVLQPHIQYRNLFTTHPVLPAYNDWMLESSEKFWTCGWYCWSLIGVAIILLLLTIVGSLSAGIAVR